MLYVLSVKSMSLFFWSHKLYESVTLLVFKSVVYSKAYCINVYTELYEVLLWFLTSFYGKNQVFWSALSY